MTKFLRILYMKLEISCNVGSVCDGSDVVAPQLTSQVSRLKPTGLCMWMDGRLV